MLTLSVPSAVKGIQLRYEPEVSKVAPIKNPAFRAGFFMAVAFGLEPGFNILASNEGIEPVITRVKAMFLRRGHVIRVHNFRSPRDTTRWGELASVK